jgi:hypothetical protein
VPIVTALQLQFNLVFELHFQFLTGHGGEIILPNLLTDDDQARPPSSPKTSFRR